MVRAIGLGIAMVGVGAALCLPLAWPVMVGFGVMHSYWHQVPSFGFWQTAILLLTLAIVMSLIALPFRSPRRDA
jgi:hypothetical protein